jgi:hypothetical protein
MSKSKFAAMIVSAGVVGVSLAGCGGSSGAGGTVVAQAGRATITEATLNHWMATFVRGDFFQATGGSKAPAGLATDPPDYGSCAKAAKTLAPSPSSGKLILTRTQLEHRCHELYRYVRQEALSYLISVLWAVGQGAELGKHVSEQQVQGHLSTIIREQYKTQQAFATYLANKGWSLADMQYILKRNLLVQKLQADAETKASRLGGGQHALVKVILTRNARWTAKTHCRAGYIVWQCREYKPTSTANESSPAIMFEEMRGARIVGASPR